MKTCRDKIHKAKYDRGRRRNETKEDRDRRNERRRELYAINPEARRKHNRQWRQSNPEKVKLQVQRRRARIKKARGRFFLGDWEEIKDMFIGLCAYCGRYKSLTIDHIIPLSRDGQHDKHNIVPACISCNSQKHTSVSGWPIMTKRKDVVEFYRKTLDDAKLMAIAFAESVS